MLGFRQLPSIGAAYGVSDLHILCRLRSESQAQATQEAGGGGGDGVDLPALKPCPVEIAEARWSTLRAVTEEMERARTQPGSEKLVRVVPSRPLLLTRSSFPPLNQY